MPDGTRTETKIYIAQGEQAVSGDPATVISTILGSCVSVCLWDSHAGVGGMNHILVPDGSMSDVSARGVGATAMETLINALMKREATRDHLVAKVFGGASVVAGLSDIGARNSVFVFDYLENERIPCLSRSVGGTQARQVRFWPASGRVQQRFVRATEAPKETVVVAVKANDLELF